MLKKLVSYIAIGAMLMTAAGSASAAVIVPGSSYLQINLAALPTIVVKGNNWHGASLTNSAGGHGVAVAGGLFSETGLQAGTSLMTGVALIVNMTLTVNNSPGAFTSNYGPVANPWGGNLVGTSAVAGSGTLCAGGCLGGLSGALSGNMVLNAGGGTLIPFPLGAVGGGGTAQVTLGGVPIVATGGPWITGKARVTGITTNLLSVPGRGGATGAGATLQLTTAETSKVITTMGGFTSTAGTAAIPQKINTVSFGGTQNLASSAVGGVVTLISPTRVNTGPLAQGTIPGVFKMHFKFVPEPGTVLLLASGAAGLVLLGRKRMKS